MARLTVESQVGVSRKGYLPKVPPIFCSLAYLVDGGMPKKHQHSDHHEFLWHVSGNLRAQAGDGEWMILPGAGLWIAAGTAHAIQSRPGSRYGYALFDPAACPLVWNRTLHVDTNVLLRSLLAHLVSDLTVDERTNAEQVVFDLLGRSLSLPSSDIPMPSDPRCYEVAEALLETPSLSFGLDSWADRVGASPRTLSRLFVAETGMTFVRWRTEVRIRAAINLLADGTDVATTARAVGYRSGSAFVALFHRFTGRTPGSFFTAPAVHDERLEPGRRVV